MLTQAHAARQHRRKKAQPANAPAATRCGAPPRPASSRAWARWSRSRLRRRPPRRRHVSTRLLAAAQRRGKRVARAGAPMKMMAGAFFSASSNALRRLDSLSPASLDMISGPLMRKKKAPVSLATARAMSVLPLPGGPYSRMPLGGFTPMVLNSCGWRSGSSTWRRAARSERERLREQGTERATRAARAGAPARGSAPSACARRRCRRSRPGGAEQRGASA